MKHILLIACLVIATPLAYGADAPAAAHPATDEALAFSGKVVETMDAATYTYVLVDTGTKKLWAAAPQFPVKLGDSVAIAAGMPMRDYHSKTLNRDFPVVYFTGGVTVNGANSDAGGKTPVLPAGHPALGGATAKPTMDLSGIRKADGGQTVGEIFAAKKSLSGKPVKVRGKVVKYNAMIMGKNWLHIQDGSGAPGSNDLTLTTDTEAKVGDTVLVTGTLSLDKDFGAGYKYGLILEDAKVIVE
jgi:hypothetical protein